MQALRLHRGFHLRHATGAANAANVAIERGNAGRDVAAVFQAATPNGQKVRRIARLLFASLPKLTGRYPPLPPSTAATRARDRAHRQERQRAGQQ